MSWLRIGQYEHEHNGSAFTGWYRCVGGQLADGRWPEWNHTTSQERFSHTKPVEDQSLHHLIYDGCGTQGGSVRP